jgi:hypothetical protein
VPLAAKAGQPLVKEAMETLEGSLKAAGRGTVAVNCKLLDMAQANVNSGLELAKRMAEAKTPLAAWRLQMAYWNERMGAFAAQAQELRALHAELCDTASAPIRAHLKRNGAARPE